MKSSSCMAFIGIVGLATSLVAGHASAADPVSFNTNTPNIYGYFSALNPTVQYHYVDGWWQTGNQVSKVMVYAGNGTWSGDAEVLCTNGRIYTSGFSYPNSTATQGCPSGAGSIVTYAGDLWSF
jgi:hypothetical protein